MGIILMNRLHNELDILIEKYKNNEYITGRLETYILQLLPSLLENANTEHVERVKRKKRLNIDKDDFIERFMHTNLFYYCPNSKLFIEYDGLHYNNYSEDDIHHKILSTITAEKRLMSWKHRITNDILYKIKNISPLKTIPESPTIQNAINIICPKLFTSRYMAKYFLTLLGDNILNKADSKDVYIISSHTKSIIHEIGYLYNMHLGCNNIVQNFKYKYYDHEYGNCRLLNNNKDYKEHYKDITREISKNIIDIFAVATYYSNRYHTADSFLKQCSDKKIVNHVLYLTQNTQTSIVDNFIKTCIVPCNGSHIETKNILFIWKKFLEERNLPGIMFNETCKSLLQNKLSYLPQDDIFTNITSISLPTVSSFISFWDSTITVDPYEDELEIDEISHLFGKWSNRTLHNITEKLLLELIRHFYPSIEIEDNKYLLKVKTTMWNKRVDVIDALNIYKLVCSENNQILSISSAYKYYISQENKVYLVSKKFFEKVTMEELGDAVDSNGIIN